MARSYDAEIDVNGRVRLLESVRLHGPCRAVVTVLESVEEAENDAAWLTVTEGSLSKDWERPEEDRAWAHLQLGT